MHTVNGISENGSVHASQQGCAHGSVRADVRFSTFLDAPRRALVPGLPERIAAVKRKNGDKNDGAAGARMAPQAPT